MIINAEGLILGRLAAFAAKRLLEGETVRIINAERAVITGQREMVFKKYKDMRKRTNKDHGPFISRMPDKIIQRTVRGMLPYKQDRGKKALKRLRVFIGEPDKPLTGDKIHPEDMHIKNSSSIKYTSLKELSNWLGKDKI